MLKDDQVLLVSFAHASPRGKRVSCMDPVFRDTELKLKNGWLCLATTRVQMKWVWFFAAGSTCFRFDPDFHLRTDLKVYIVSVFIFQRAVDPHFCITDDRHLRR